MKRVIYSPTVAELERAENLSKSLKLPIQIGDSPLTEILDFDRSNIQVISIPSVKELFYPTPIFSQITFMCDLTNEWIDFLDIDVRFEAHNVATNEAFYFSPSLKELHYVRFCPRLNDPGIYMTMVLSDQEVFFKQEVEVL